MNRLEALKAEAAAPAAPAWTDLGANALRAYNDCIAAGRRGGYPRIVMGNVHVCRINWDTGREEVVEVVESKGLPINHERFRDTSSVNRTASEPMRRSTRRTSRFSSW